MKDLGHPRFQSVDATVTFIRTIDHLFDILNSRVPVASGYKKPISRGNFHRTVSTLQDMDTFLHQLRIRGTKIIGSNKGTGFIGFSLCIHSLIDLSHELLFEQPNPLRYVLTYKFSQDHLELLFNAIRGSLGWNNNPSAKQLEYVMRRLHARVGINGDSSGNCVNFSVESEDLKPNDVIEETEPVNSAFVINIVCYIAGFVVRKLLKHDDCFECRAALVCDPQDSDFQSDDRHFLRLKNNGGLVLPSKDVVHILQRCESLFRSLNLMNRKPERLFLKIYSLLGDSVFSSTHMTENNHRYRIVRSIVFVYCAIRSHHVARMYNLSDTSFSRPRLTKQIHFRSD
jgi:hypothetical protein